MVEAEQRPAEEVAAAIESFVAASSVVEEPGANEVAAEVDVVIGLADKERPATTSEVV